MGDGASGVIPGVGYEDAPHVAMGGKDYGGRHNTCVLYVITCYTSVVCVVLLLVLGLA